MTVPVMHNFIQNHPERSQPKGRSAFGAEIFIWKCTRCGLEVASPNRPNRMKPRDMVTKKRLDCDEVIVARVSDA